MKHSGGRATHVSEYESDAKNWPDRKLCYPVNKDLTVDCVLRVVAQMDTVLLQVKVIRLPCQNSHTRLSCQISPFRIYVRQELVACTGIGNQTD